MDEKEKALFDKIQQQMKALITDSEKGIKEGLMTKEDVTKELVEIKKSLETIATKADSTIVNDLEKQIKELNEAIKGMKVNGKKEAEKGLFSLIAEKAGAIINDYKEKGKAIMDFDVKSALGITMGISVSVGTGVILEDREPGINAAPTRKPVMTDVILTGSTGSDRVTWVEKTDEAGNPAFKKEFETMSKRSWKTVLKTAYVKEISVLAEYSKLILEDLTGFMEELRRDLSQAINLTLDENILRGTGGGVSDADLKGVLQYAQPWSNVFGTVTKYVKNANIFDVANVGVTQIAKEHHNATVILMCESTALDMELAKDANGNYVFPMWAGNKRVKNIPVVTNELFNEGEMLIMDGSKVMLKWKRGWTLEMTDSHGDNFAQNVLAVRLTGRAALRIKDTDAKAFVYVASVADAIDALTEKS